VIFGLGTDVVEIGRIEKALGRWGERFAERILCASELVRFKKHKQPVAYLAKRFAAKEAFTKALGTGIKAPANWHGVWVVNQRSGKPELQFSEPLIQLLSTHGVTRSHLSLADERGIAVATVILECAK
jgi:holo-[acyl-carrier protein] synthase